MDLVDCCKRMWLNLLLGLFITALGRFCDGVRCFCTEEHCSFGVCDSQWCLVGIKHSGPVLRTCGNEAARMLRICRKSVGDWYEVCACDTPFCNTFAFLRHQIKYNRFADSKGGQSEEKTPNPSLFAHNQKSYEVFSKTKLNGGERTAEYVRQKPKNTNRFSKTNFVKDGKHSTRKAQKASYLAIVLVIVPLSVGGAAVLLVAMNYYCHLC